MVNHVLAAGCQLVDGLGVVGQGLFQYLMLLHLCLGTQLVLGEGTVASGKQGSRCGRKEQPELCPGPHLGFLLAHHV